MPNQSLRVGQTLENLPRWPLIVGVTAAALTVAALFNRAAAKSAEAEHPPLGDFVEVDGARVHYVERGQGPAIVLIHGSASLIQDFLVSGIVDTLSQTNRVIVFDRPGYGYTPRPRDRDWTPEAQATLFAAACATLGVERPLVVGHSWGTLPALAWALDHPDAVRGLVLMSGYYYGTPRPDAIPTGILASPILGDLLTATIAPLQTRLTGVFSLKMIFSPSQVTGAFMKQMPFPLMLRPGQLHATAADSGQMPLAARRLQRRYGKLTLPITIVWDNLEKLVGQPGQSVRLARDLPFALPVQLDGAGHMLHHTRPKEVSDAIRAAAA